MTHLVANPATRHSQLAELRGGPRFTDADTPAPAYIARVRDSTAALMRAATLATTQDPS